MKPRQAPNSGSPPPPAVVATSRQAPSPTLGTDYALRLEHPWTQANLKHFQMELLFPDNALATNCPTMRTPDVCGVAGKEGAIPVMANVRVPAAAGPPERTMDARCSLARNPLRTVKLPRSPLRGDSCSDCWFEPLAQFHAAGSVHVHQPNCRSPRRREPEHVSVS